VTARAFCALLAFCLSGCAFDGGCVEPVNWALPENSCPDVTVRWPDPSECMRVAGATTDSCASRQQFRCGDGVTMIVGTDNEDGSGDAVLTDERTGCETRWHAEGDR
jgi:hypothetical protein